MSVASRNMLLLTSDRPLRASVLQMRVDDGVS